MDRGAWQATVLRITKSWTRLKQLSMHTRMQMITTNNIKKTLLSFNNYWNKLNPFLLPSLWGESRCQGLEISYTWIKRKENSEDSLLVLEDQCWNSWVSLWEKKKSTSTSHHRHASSGHEAGHPKPSALGQPRGIGWGGRWERGSGSGGHMYTHGWFMLMYGKKKKKKPTMFKLIILQVKSIN